MRGTHPGSSRREEADFSCRRQSASSRRLLQGRVGGRAHSAAGLRAFTLIELMVVLVIIAIMTAMIIPEMRGTYDDALLRSYSRDLVSVFNLGYSRAVSLNRVHRVRFDLTSHRYLLERSVAEGETLSGFAAVDDIPGAEGPIDARIQMQIQASISNLDEDADAGASPEAPETLPSLGGDPTISFYPDGTADGRDLLLRDRAGFGVLLRINPVTARVHIEEAERQ
jgi:prepilin-type N-terminal cleavage/methylation domain-containing protein